MGGGVDGKDKVRKRKDRGKKDTYVKETKINANRCVKININDVS